MPELPEVETVCRALRPILMGREIRRVRVFTSALRQRLDPGLLRDSTVGRRVRAVRRRGKYLIVDLTGDLALVCHLGMTGAFRACPAGAPPRTHDHVAWLIGAAEELRYSDVRRFGSIQVSACDPRTGMPVCLVGLGPEPLAPGFDADYLYAQTRARSRPIKNLLLDQAVVAGVGNIYACEALFRAGIAPTRPGRRLSRAQCQALTTAIRDTLAAAIAAGGTTISDFHSVDGTEGRFHRQLLVYGRADEPCGRCQDRRIRRAILAGRSTFYCPGCQR